MASIPSYRQKITAADALDVVGWSGNSGLKAQADEAADLLHERGVMIVGSLALLGMLSSADAKIVIVRGVGLYVYNATSSGSAALDVPASGGGRWQHQIAFGTTEYSQVVGNSSDTSFTIAHNLGTLFPTIDTWAPSAPGGSSGYTLQARSLITSVTAVDENTSTVVFGSAPASSQYTLVFKK